MSTPYFCCPQCLHNSVIPDEILEKFRNKEGSFIELMSCDNCGSTPEKRKARSQARMERLAERFKNTPRPETIAERYERWWVGNLCRLVGSGAPFRRVVSLNIYGPPSLFNAVVELVYEDKTIEAVTCGVNAYRPRKKDVEILKEDG